VTLSIDTNVFVDLIRGRQAGLRERFRLAVSAAEPVVASLIVLQELLYGAEIARNPAAQHLNVRQVLSGIEVQAFDERDIATCAQLRSRLRSAGLAIGAYDALIAGQALARGWTVVTANTREFARIDGLNVIDWTAPAA
jgi:tRNA(fMet)-specific endonuclease VapC